MSQGKKSKHQIETMSRGKNRENKNKEGGSEKETKKAHSKEK